MITVNDISVQFGETLESGVDIYRFYRIPLFWEQNQKNKECNRLKKNESLLNGDSRRYNIGLLDQLKSADIQAATRSTFTAQ